MPYIQNTESDQAEMMKAIGIKNKDELFRCIPESIRLKGNLDIPKGMPEMDVVAEIKSLGAKNRPSSEMPSFLGAGVYHHFIPAVVDNLASRSEFVTAYTPYQPELSQGALQAFFEYQTLICMLTGMEISNASMYDGASAMAEAALMAVDTTKRKRVLVSETVHPEFRAVLTTYLQRLDVDVVELPVSKDGSTSMEKTDGNLTENTAAVILQNPNFFGCIEDVEPSVSLAKARGAFSIVSTDPVSLSVLKPPGQIGADITTGEGQGLGVPMSFGGPGFGFLSCAKKLVRRIPGRIVGQTVDRRGKPGYVLTFQAREQHIRRERATSNICTNNALMAIRALVYMTALGREGFGALGRIILKKSHGAAKRIAAIDGFDLTYTAPFFKEFVVRCPIPASKVSAALLENGIISGYDLGRDYTGCDKLMLFCVTETTSDSDVEKLAEVLKGLG